MKTWNQIILQEKSIEPLVTFRILFGGLLFFGTLRFLQKGWIEKLYGEPTFFFKFYGFDWVQPLSVSGMYWVYSLIALSAFGIMLGLFYRLSTISFFLLFSYTELIDATNYLNHYYLVAILGFLLIFLPANKAYALDVYFKPSIYKEKIPAWCINIIILQLTMVYTFAGIAKLNSDWLFHAMPLAIWLPEHTDIPLIGYFFQFKWAAFIFSWCGALYDLSIAYFLMNSKTRPIAYVGVVVFHVLTALLFNIGLFPYIMIFNTLIFFSADFHKKLLRFIPKKRKATIAASGFVYKGQQFILPFFVVFFFVQCLLPFRHFLYKGNVLWTEEGYRLSWRVMLVEKTGHATFYVEDQLNNRKTEIQNKHFLTDFQEKQMSIQPDFIVQFAQYLDKEFQTNYGIKDPVVTADVFVAYNGRTSQRLIDNKIDLSEITPSLKPKEWILRYE